MVRQPECRSRWLGLFTIAGANDNDSQLDNQCRMEGTTNHGGTLQAARSGQTPRRAAQTTGVGPTSVVEQNRFDGAPDKLGVGLGPDVDALDCFCSESGEQGADQHHLGIDFIVGSSTSAQRYPQAVA